MTVGAQQKVTKAIGILLSAGLGCMSLIVLGSGIAKIIAGHSNSSLAVNIASGAFFLAVAFICFSPGLFALRKQARRRADVEIDILKAAALHHGKVTVAEVAAAGGMPLNKAEAELAKASHKGLCTIEVTGNGTVVYVFAGFLTDEERESTTDPLE